MKEMRDGIGSMSRRSTDGKQTSRRRGRSSYIAPEGTGALAAPVAENEEEGQWANLPPELLHDIIQMIESNRTAWPGRRDVVVCASVCMSWRAVTKELIRTPESCGLLTFPVSLKQVLCLYCDSNLFVCLDGWFSVTVGFIDVCVCVCSVAGAEREFHSVLYQEGKVYWNL